MTVLMQHLICQQISTSAHAVKVSQDFPLPAGCHSIKKRLDLEKDRSEAVHNWLHTTWLSIPQVNMYA